MVVEGVTGGGGLRQLGMASGLGRGEMGCIAWHGDGLCNGCSIKQHKTSLDAVSALVCV